MRPRLGKFKEIILRGIGRLPEGRIEYRIDGAASQMSSSAVP